MQTIREALTHRILVLDGAMGTAIQNFNLKAHDFGGTELEGCNENLILTRPDIISSIHENYLQAGCDILETNTFGATPLVLAEYGLQDQATLINQKAATLAKSLALKYSTPDKPRYVAGSIGPTTKAISVTGGATFEELRDHFYLQAKALQEGGVDYFLIETCQDTRNIKAALVALEKVAKDTGVITPIAVSGTIEATGTMLAGQSIEALYASLAHLDLLYIGINCATGPEFMTDHIRSLAKLSRFPIAVVPNAGLPDEHGCYLESPSMVAQVLERFASNGWLNVMGGCCGTHAGHIQALAEVARRHPPRKEIPAPRSFLSGVDFLEVNDEVRPLVVGERTNVIGSKKFKTLICEEKFEEASDIARSQIKGGAQIIDVCLANPDRPELSDMTRFFEFAAKKVRVPFMIDSTDAAVIERALTFCQGKAIINSINLEDGEERFEKIVPLAKRYGAALVVGTIDDDPKQGMGITRERKLAIASREYELLTRKYRVEPEDLYFDPLVFPCATGDAQYLGSALETIEGIRLIKKQFPRSKTILGISNVSFGLPTAGREILNSVFLYHCVQSGLDLAIVNAEKLERYASMGDTERTLAENLLFMRGEDPVAAFAAHFRDKKAKSAPKMATLPLKERLSRYVVEGSKDGLVNDLNEALQTLKPLEIINGPLMSGMDEVGRLFNANQLIVAEVLQSAEVMKTAVSHLEPHMEKAESASRGKILLATVKGDVHDIGKNLVEIILSNNGFEVINLGIKIPPEQLIQATQEHQPDIVGLSGLLVKSAQQMVATAEDFSKAGITTPILVGGAALSERFVDSQIAKAYTTGTVTYAKDAMAGLDLAKTIVSPERFEELKAELTSRRTQTPSVARAEPITAPAMSTQRSSAVSLLSDFPKPTDFERHVLKPLPGDHIWQIWKYINPLMLYGRHLGIKGGVVRLLEKMRSDPKIRQELANSSNPSDAKSLSIWDTVEEVKQEYCNTDIMRPSAIYQFFKAHSEGNQIFLRHPNSNQILTTFDLPRQKKPDGLCLADYVFPKNGEQKSDSEDNMAVFVVSVGKGIRELAENLKQRGDYLRSHIVQALALESAEAYAELLHSQIRHIWGFSDPVNMTLMERFQAKYRGKRYSFGYPACPRLDDQQQLFDLLNPSEIGVQLTEGMMMDPESSVSALVFHHPQATYFSVGGSDEQR